MAAKSSKALYTKHIRIFFLVWIWKIVLPLEALQIKVDVFQVILDPFEQ